MSDELRRTYAAPVFDELHGRIRELETELAALKNHLGGWHACDGDCGQQRATEREKDAEARG